MKWYFPGKVSWALHRENICDTSQMLRSMSHPGSPQCMKRHQFCLYLYLEYVDCHIGTDQARLICEAVFKILLSRPVTA